MAAPAETARPARLGTAASLRVAFRSWRLAAVSLLGGVSSGLPLGLVWISIPYWMQQEGIDIKSIGLITLAQAPYTFKFLWSPLMDRFAPRRGRKRFWIAVGQAMLAVSIGALALSTGRPRVGAVTLLALLISFSSATQDIAVDAYAVEVLRKEEQGLAVGARIALYRAAMYLSGAVAITLGPAIGWPAVFGSLAALFVLLLPVTALAPEPDAIPPPPASLGAAVWEPFVGFFRQPRALEIVGFLFFYKFADNVATSLTRPFLGQMGYGSVDVGIATGTIGIVATIGGTFLGGLACNAWGVGRALWAFGLLQALAGGAYAVVAVTGVNRLVMYGAIAVELSVIGMGTAAFNVLMLRLTQRRFSATQYALFTCVFALGRTVAGPPAGILADALGWRDFFLLTIPMAIPGLVLLHRFVPWGSREVPEADDTEVGPTALGRPLAAAAIAARSALSAAAATAAFYAMSGLLGALRLVHGGAGRFDLVRAFGAIAHPQRPGDWLDLLGPPVAGLLVGLATAAYLAARHGVGSRAAPREREARPPPARSA